MDISVIFVPVVTLLTAQITVLDLAQFRYSVKKLVIFMILLLMLQVSVNAPILIFEGYDGYVNNFFTTIILPQIIAFWFASKRRGFKDLFTVLVTIFLSFVIAIPAMWITQTLDDGYLWYNISRILFFVLLFLLLHFIVRKRYIQVQNEIEKGWGIFCILPLLGICALYYNYWIIRKTRKFLDILLNCSVIILFMAGVFMIFFYVFAQLHEKYQIQEQQRILSMQNRAQRDQFEQQKEAAEKTNRRWHDLRHNIQELIELLEAGNAETALAYLKEQRGMDEVVKEEYCLHPAVNSILCLWAERSRMADIKVNIKADVPVKLSIDPMELSALFANAFENAYEGCLRLPEEVQKYIKVEANYNGKRLAIGITNTCIQNIKFENNMPVSSKEGGGIGTRSIAYTVSRFHGAVFYEAKEGIFTARFILNI